MESEKRRVWRTAAEKRRIVELTLQPGMSVARVAQAEGVNSHQVFQWRRSYRQGTLGDAGADCTALLPVVVSEPGNETETKPSGAIHIEFPGRATITAESGADGHLLRAVLEALQQ
jgi:Transposase and inactivated derivatives